MIRRLILEEFTMFRKTSLDFSAPGINLIIGENGRGKTHLLKLAYLFTGAWGELSGGRRNLGKQQAEAILSNRLLGLFRPERLGSLSRAGGSGKTRIQAKTMASIPTVRIRTAGEPAPGPLPHLLEWSLCFSRRMAGAAWAVGEDGGLSSPRA